MVTDRTPSIAMTVRSARCSGLHSVLLDANFAELRRFGREQLLRTLRRWSLLVVAAAALGGAVAFGVSTLAPAQYRATAQLFLVPAPNPTVPYQDVVLGQYLARSYVHLATAEVVLRPAMARSGWTDLAAFRERTQVAQFRDTSVLTVSFRDTDPARAAEAANAVAAAFIDQTRGLQTTLQGSAVSQLEVQIASVEDEIKSLDRQIAGLRAELAAVPGLSPAVRTELQSQLIQLDGSRQSKQQTLAQLLKTRDEMRLAAARAEQSVSLWQEATPPTAPESPRPLLNALLGAVIAALVVVGILAAVAYLDDRLNDLDQLRIRLDLNPLAEIQLGENPESLLGKLFVRDRPTTSEAEAFRSLRTNVVFAGVDDRPGTLLVTSARAGEGKSVISANLALAFVESGSPTILVDTDLRRPSLHRLFRVPPTPGLTTLLAAEPGSPIDLQSFRVASNLVVIPSGPLPPNPAQMLSSARMSALLDHLKRSAAGGIVILDSSPVLAVADPVMLATKVDACLLVIDAGRTHTSTARHAIDALRRVRATVMGGVLNKTSRWSAEYYGYEYGLDDGRARTRSVQRRRA